MRFITIIVAFWLALTAVVHAQDFNKGVSAAQAGDWATALSEWRPLAEQGDASAQHNLGLMYYEGHGVLQDYAEAKRWWQLAAEQGLAHAQNKMGLMYYEGNGVLQDYAEAKRWWQLAAEQGLASAQNFLGFMYAWGNGVPQNYVAAHMWMNIAAANGHPVAADARDIVAKEMTPADISEAQRRARTCMESNYKDCD